MKIFLISMSLLALSTSLASEEMQLSAGGFYSAYSQDSIYTDNTESFDITGAGVAIRAYKPVQKSQWGGLVSASLYLPQQMAFDYDDGSSSTLNLQTEAESCLGVSGFVGPAYTTEILERLTLTAGVGYVFTWLYLEEANKNYSLLLNGFGMDLGFKYSVKDSFFIEAGSTLTLQLYSHEKVTASGVTREFTNRNLKALEVKPFVGLGVKLGG